MAAPATRADRTACSGTSTAPPALPSFVFIDTPPEVRGELERWAPGASFTTTYEDLQAVLKRARKGR